MPKNYSLEFTSDSHGNIWEGESSGSMQKSLFNDAYIFVVVMNDNENLKKLEQENFDLGLTELFDPCGFGVFEKIGLKKYITTFGSSLFPPSAALLGIKLHPSYIPGVFSAKTDKMNFVDRVQNFFTYFFENLWIKQMLTVEIEKVVQKTLPNFDMDKTIANSAFYFVNSDEHIDYPQPITQKIIYIAGLGKVQAQPLEKKYTDIFDSSKKGVILFSFGSVVQSHEMKAEQKQAFLDAFSEFPDINFIWKYEKDEHQIAKGHKNVFTGKWLPQNDILDHPKLLAFISHGGMNSVMEGSTKGIPLICIPIFADQARNSMLLVRRGTAIKIDKTEISKASIVAGITEIISNKKYAKNAKQLSKMVNSKPFPGIERVVKYAEFAAEFGDTGTLQAEGANQSFIVLYSLDVIAFLLAVVGLVIFIAVWIIKKFFKFLKGKLFVFKDKKIN
uniref:Glucuronosyltransferase n=1 Tax=Panagrolaimus sp. ES5 TaxID=591445 RepID=A0AC34FI16_9BILA